MATFKHISSKNADYGAAEAYLTFEHDEFTMKPTLDENGRLIPREDYRISSLNCGGEDFAVACMRANLRYEKNQKREDVKSHHYIISFDPRDGPDNGLTNSISCLSCCLSCGCFNSCDRVSDTDRISCCLFSVSCFVTTRCERYCYDSYGHQN